MNFAGPTIYLYWTESTGRRYGRCRFAWLAALVSAIPAWFISLHYATDCDAGLRPLEQALAQIEQQMAAANKVASAAFRGFGQPRVA